MRIANLIRALIAGPAFVATIAFTQEEAPPAAGDAAEAAEVVSDAVCFSIRQAQRMSGLHDQFLYLQSGQRSFLLTMAHTCPGLSDAREITILQRAPDLICSNDRVDISYRRFGISGITTCPIQGVEEVENREAAETLAAERAE
jgi:hypothetical protein